MLNDAQLAAVNSKSNRIVCLAGAGTGKSTVLLARIAKLIEDGADPSSILALTFTNAAAFEMKDRFKSSNHKSECPEFRTFHSFCYHLLSMDKAIREKLGYSQVPSIASASAEKKIILEAKLQTGIKLSDKLIFEHVTLDESQARDLYVLLKAADRLMKQRNLITFDNLCKNVCDLFISNDATVMAYKKQYRYILADEYQDSDRKQHDFVMSFHDSHIFVVGDALQNLYAFRGTSSEMIKQLSEDPTWTTIKLTENYRSTKEICEYANKYSKSYAKESYRIAMTATKAGEDVYVSEYSAESRGSVPESLMSILVDRISDQTGTSAILVRTNAEVASMQEYLRDNHIPFISKRSDIHGHNILSCVLDDNYAIEWLATFLSAELYSEYIRRDAIKRQSSRPYTLYEFINEFGSNKDISDCVSKIYQIRKICKDDSSVVAKQRKILKALGYDSAVKLDASEIKTLSDMLTKLSKSLESYTETAVNLYVGTIHSVKGLEYDNVYVVGPRSYSWPLNNEDNHNLFYVAVTRAKTHLSIYFAH